MPRHELGDELERTPDLVKSGIDLARDIKNSLDQPKDAHSPGAGVDIRQAEAYDAAQTSYVLPNTGGANSSSSAGMSTSSRTSSSSMASSRANVGAGASSGSASMSSGSATTGGSAAGAKESTTSGSSLKLVKILIVPLLLVFGTILITVILETVLPKTVSGSVFNNSNSNHTSLDDALKGRYQEYIDFTKGLVNDAVAGGRSEVEQKLSDGNYYETEFIKPEVPVLSTSISYMVAYYGVYAGENASFESYKEELQKHKNELYVYRFHTEDIEIILPPPATCDYTEVCVTYTDLSGVLVTETLYLPIEGTEKEPMEGEMVYTYEALSIPNAIVKDEEGERLVLIGTYYRRSDEMIEAVSSTETVTKAIAEEVEISISFLSESWPLDLTANNAAYGGKNIDVLRYHTDFLASLCPDEHYSSSGFVQRTYVSDEGLFGFLFSGVYDTFNTGKNSPAYCRQKLDEIANTQFPDYMIPDKQGMEGNWLATAPIPFRQIAGDDSCYYLGPSGLVILSKDGSTTYYIVRSLDNNMQTLVKIEPAAGSIGINDSERITRIENASFLSGNRVEINGIVHTIRFDYIYYPANVEFGYPRFHKNVIGILRSVWATLANMNYVFGSTNLYTYEYRYMNNPTTGPTGSLSYHSYGIATDIGWSFARQTKEVWLSYGFYSGLDWEEYDPPHMCLSNH